jgi:hypothetical protein
MILGHPSAAKSTSSRREYTKKDLESLDILIRDIQADPKRVRLLQILGHQLELLINEGRPDLHSLYTSLKAETIVSEEECRELSAIFALEAVSYSCAIKEVTD